MGIYSPYAVAESEQPQWKPGENLAAAAFVGIALFIVLDVNVGIWRVFRKRTGYYYWSMKLGTLACAVDALGVILKYLVPNSAHIWGLYTFLLLSGWSIYAPAQLLVLYSRLHLVNESYRLQRWVLIMITSTIFLIIIPTWIVVWPAYDPDPKISSLWSPRDAIVERYNQIGYTLVELVLSGIYVWSLLGLLNLKSSVRQRRVMLDLVYVNIIIVLFDILVVILLYLNQVGISHPIQTFSYALKLKLEFVVLNQLMAVAARGLQRESFEEKRYHHSSAHDAFSAECRRWDEKAPTDPREKTSDSDHDDHRKSLSIASAQITVPEPVLSRGNQSPRQSTTDDNFYDHSNMNEDVFGAEQEFRLENFLEDDSGSSKAGGVAEIRTYPSQAFSGETLRTRESSTPEESSSHIQPRRLRDAKNKALRSMHHPLGHDKGQGAGNRRQPMRATMKRHMPRRGENSDEEEEEEIGVHMWENHGKFKMETPWFKSMGEA
ncbi:hypothetical protein HO133_006637 [Letharia lupina]|uniref:DUF7703 domain-containing protein n=1 Tax=Letharia lupina TaxID=560253 RepID=A0A8H6C6K0_9LECA|nr:uncharacterized protein HO133_006637 [Letharia lupina]KAF6217810.1 hypothetical protein HO133_006637 [Letharia lupina]